MNKLNKNETLEVIGGASFSLGFAGAATAVCAFLIGIFEGFINPKKCN